MVNNPKQAITKLTSFYWSFKLPLVCFNNWLSYNSMILMLNISPILKNMREKKEMVVVREYGYKKKLDDLVF